MIFKSIITQNIILYEKFDFCVIHMFVLERFPKQLSCIYDLGIQKYGRVSLRIIK